MQVRVWPADPARAGDWRAEPDSDGLVRRTATGSAWQPRLWVSCATGALTAGATRVLVGTRALLGEGWDAPCVNCLVDLTAATTATSTSAGRSEVRRAPHLGAEGEGKSGTLHQVVGADAARAEGVCEGAGRTAQMIGDGLPACPQERGHAWREREDSQFKGRWQRTVSFHHLDSTGKKQKA